MLTSTNGPMVHDSYIRLFYGLILAIVVWVLIVNQITPYDRRLSWTLKELESPGTVTVDGGGGLEYRMRQYATLWGISKQYSIDGAGVLPDTRDTLVKTFPGLTLPKTNGSKDTLARFKTSHIMHNPDTLLEKVRRSGVLLVEGTPLGIEFFQEYRSEILNEFTFRPDISARAQSTLLKLGHNGLYIGVHVTLLKDHRPRWMAEVKHCFQVALDTTRKLFPNAIYVVAGDEEEWAKQHVISMSTGDMFWVGQRDNPELDMAILSACNHSVILHDLFGFWAGYLAGGMVFLPNSGPFTEDIRKADMTGWIFLDVN